MAYLIKGAHVYNPDDLGVTSCLASAFITV